MKLFSLHNKHDFIETQLQSFRKNLKEDFEFIVFDNAAFTVGSQPGESEKINETCARLGVRVIEILKDPEIVKACEAIETTCKMFDRLGLYSNANVASAYPLCWAWARHMHKEREPIVLMHSDIFLTREGSFSDILNEYQVCFVPQSREGAHEYMWDVFVILDMAKLSNPETINWYCGKVNGVAVDVGGQTGHYLKSHPELKLLRVDFEHFDKFPVLDFVPSDYEIFSINGKETLIHYRSGSNWNHRTSEYHEKKLAWLKARVHQ